MDMEEIVALSVKHNVCYIELMHTTAGDISNGQNNTIRVLKGLKY